MSLDRHTFSVLDFGACGDRKTMNTAAIQATIDACTAAGGGTVRFSPGAYVSGTVYLKDNVRLHLDAGAVLLASTDMDDFPSIASAYPCYTGEKVTLKSLIYAEDAVNIGIVGSGTIDGRLEELKLAFGFPSFSKRPRLIHLRGCRRVKVKDITLRDSASWVQHYKLCEDVEIDGLTVDSRDNPDIEKTRFADKPGMNQDGLDIDACRNVRVSNCHINSGDDGICLKSRAEAACENITVTNCTVSCNASAIKLGTESNGGYRNIAISNCTVFDTRISGIDIIEVDGGLCENVTVSNIVMDNVKGAAIFVRLCNRGRPLSAADPAPPVGAMRHIQISNVTATRIGGCCGETDQIQRIGCSITGIPGHCIEGVTVRDVTIRFIGGGSPQTCLQSVPEQEHDYPYPLIFGGDLPAYGFYCRHVRRLRLENLTLSVEEKDTRPPVVLDDVQHCHVTDIFADTFAETETVVHSVDSTNVVVSACSGKEDHNQKSSPQSARIIASASFEEQQSDNGH